MSKRTQIKEMKKMMTGSGASSINGMFDSMMGLSDADVDVIRPKLVETRNILRHLYRVFSSFAGSSIQTDFPFTVTGMQDIMDFMNKLRDSIVIENINDKNAKETEELYAKFDQKTLNDIYRKFKENDYIKQLIVQCGRLKQWSNCFNDKENLKDNFIGQEPGLSFYIFNFSSLDLKQLWADRHLKPYVKSYILNILHSVYTDLFKIYKIITSPDVNIDQFTTVLLSSIDQLKKTPGLHRCTSAFRRIEQSVELLKGNFNTYYRDSVSAANPNMLIESFIIDVSNQGDANPRLTREFRQIIQYMHKASNNSGKPKDPKIQKLFDMLNKNFEVMEKNSNPIESTGETDSENTKSDIPNETPNGLPNATPNETPNGLPNETLNETPNETPNGLPNASDPPLTKSQKRRQKVKKRISKTNN